MRLPNSPLLLPISFLLLLLLGTSAALASSLYPSLGSESTAATTAITIPEDPATNPTDINPSFSTPANVTYDDITEHHRGRNHTHNNHTSDGTTGYVPPGTALVAMLVTFGMAMLGGLGIASAVALVLSVVEVLGEGVGLVVSLVGSWWMEVPR
ncbi:hypothetical protein GE21DRAFT_72 [Neurospora crassa]|uniref:Uncharacterized protein n=1 Tax=Neurospora crassa (strain ATCC 24698 / 74-OR23-1A / CBS 708.71 / DSM 1257 / FGSC 987) TaxID=367110 RepID=Q7SGI4_NEUCR|nr:hypothetical protein NCU08100 [Neurospora crassa OR74A]EAA35995.1 hypothetical protein NCU08100 [Neurospora crassa OR74A]KHE84524.1 hypothetical protein GE21DRAFT_72 [Neurospora crassa]|eukprot:XP_965231.1 hypothetical protein NCU08100 [Neurospora crassa OR74A]